MASKIILKKSNVASKVPAVGDLDYGELALNYTDGKLWYKNNSNVITQLNASSGSTYSTYTSNVTATDKQAIIANTSGGAFTVTLPATPAAGAQVDIADGGNWSINNLTVARNGSTIEGLAEDIILDIGGAAVTFIYSGTTWEVFSQIGAAGGNAGFKNVPPVGTKSSSYTLAVADVGRYVQVTTGGSIIIPDAVFSEGDVVSIFNNTSGAITITCSIKTAYVSGIDTDKATVSLATRGIATILFISGTVCVISGSVS